MTDTPTIGHNLPPLTPETIKAQLTTSYGELLARHRELLDALKRLPAQVTTEDQSKDVTDYAGQLKACSKECETQRNAAKAPYLKGGRLVDGFFNDLKDQLDEADKAARAVLKPYLDAKAERERQEREAEARAAQEEADRKAKEAEAAERKAREEREAAQREIRDKQRQLDEQKQENADLKRQNQQLERDTTIAKGRAARAESKASALARKARLAEGEAKESEKRAEEPTHKLGKVHGRLGTTSQLKDKWAFKVVDWKKLPKAQLWPYLSHDAIEAAINAAVRAGVRDIKGVDIYEIQKTEVR